jgi:hypothetical protein
MPIQNRPFREKDTNKKTRAALQTICSTRNLKDRDILLTAIRILLRAYN